MPRGKSDEDLVMLQMALIGYERQKERIVERIREIEALLKGKSAASPSVAAVKAAKPAGGKRVMSPAARKRISAAQKKRWAEQRKREAKGLA